MEINILDRSKYLKGLMVLSRKDNYLSQREREILKQVGKTLGFEKRFIESAINDLMVNKYLTEEPIEFSEKYVAESFIKNGILLATSDGKLDKREASYLWKVANLNGIPKDNFLRILSDFGQYSVDEKIFEEIFDPAHVA